MRLEEGAAETLLRKLRGGECPLVNGVTLASGEVYPQELSRVRGRLGYTVSLRPGKPTSLASLREEGALEWTHVTELCRDASPGSGVRVRGGEGGYGGDGFILVSRGEDDRPEWVAFFDEANPFVEVRLTETQVHAVTTYDDRWTFDLAQPGEVSVEAGDPKGWRDPGGPR